jgi:hypothetical protein
LALSKKNYFPWLLALNKNFFFFFVLALGSEWGRKIFSFKVTLKFFRKINVFERLNLIAKVFFFNQLKTFFSIEKKFSPIKVCFVYIGKLNCLARNPFSLSFFFGT